MKHEQEISLFQIVAVLCFLMMIGTAWKYTQLKHAYTQAEKDKVHYCKEYHKAKCSIEQFLDAEVNKGNKK